MIFLNNKIVSANRAVISVYDHGFLYGDGIYETLRSYGGTVFMLDEHIRRLFRSAALISMDIGKTPEEVRNTVAATLTANRLRDAVIRITVSRGTGPTGLDPELCKKRSYVVMAHRFRKYPQQYYRHGVRVSVVSTRRNYRGALNPQIKSLNFLNNVLAKIEAKKNDAFEAVMLNYRGYVAECTVSNIFFVKDEIIYTPGIPVGLLDGITRRAIIECARESGFEVIEGYFRKEDLYGAEEVFLSNTSMEIMPVSYVDDVALRYTQGGITKKMQRAYKKKVKNYIRHRQ